MNQVNQSEALQVVNAGKERSATNSQVFIVAHHDFSVDGIVSILAEAQDTYLVSCVEPGDSCRQKFISTKPDILMIHKSAIQEPINEFFSGVLTDQPNVRILIFGQGMSEEFLFHAVRAGVHGYINEKMTGDHLLRAIDAVKRGETWVERKVMQRFIAGQSDVHSLITEQFGTRMRSLGQNLTPREKEILGKILQGLATKQIAEEVHLSHQGVKVHLGKLFRKFEVSNRSQLILAAFDQIGPAGKLSVMMRDALVV